MTELLQNLSAGKGDIFLAIISCSEMWLSSTKDYENLNFLSLLLLLIYGFRAGDEDDQFEEEKELIIKEIELVTQQPNLGH